MKTIVVLFLVAALTSATAQSYNFTTIAGGSRGSRDGAGPNAQFDGPAGIAVDNSGMIYVADMFNDTIRGINATGEVTTIAGVPQVPGLVDADTSRAARFWFPTGVAVGRGYIVESGALGDGYIYIADNINSTIRRIAPDGKVRSVAGSLIQGNTDGPGFVARFRFAAGCAVDGNANIFVADTGNHTIRKITPPDTTTTVAGTAGIAGEVDGEGRAAQFRSPNAVAVDNSGNVYVADTGNHTIRKITSGGVVTTVAGAAGVRGASDGTGAAARFNDPMGVAVDGEGNIFVADSSNRTIRKITPAGVVTTIGGSAGQLGTDDGVGSVARFFRPYGITLGPGGVIFVTDAGVNSVRKGAPIATAVISAAPQSQAVTVGGRATFTVSAAGASPLTYQWRKDGIVIPGATSSTLTIANVLPTDAGAYTVVVTNAAGSVTSTAGTLTVQPIPPSIVTPPVSQSVLAGNTVTLAVVAGVNVGLTYQWRRDGAVIAGAVGASYTIPFVQPGDAGTYTVTITNSAGSVISSPVILAVVGARLVNLSILTSLSSPGDSFTLGYVVGGSGTSGLKPLLIRAAGPSLAALGVGGALADPKIELFAGATRVAENDNWNGAPSIAGAMVSVGAFPFVNAGSRDAAILTNITGGDNSVRVSAADGGTGLVIAEVYDATAAASLTASSPRLVNVSVLKNIGSNLTAGFVIVGSASKSVLIRAIGPTLGAAPFNVTGVMADPQLTLFSGQTAIESNDNWGSPLRSGAATAAQLSAAFSQVGAFALPSGSRDAAVLATLAPGNYTVQVSGVDNTSGMALVEVYEVP